MAGKAGLKLTKKGLKKSIKQSARRYNKRKATKQAKSNTDTKFVRIEQSFTLKPTQGVKVSNYVSWFPQLCDPTGTNPVSAASSPKFGIYAYMYDRVRINRMKITITPKANVLDQGNAQLDTDYNLTGDGLVHTCLDRNSAPPQSIQAIQYYPSYKSYSNLKKFVRVYSVKYPRDVWLDCKNGKIDFSDTTFPSKLGLFGGIMIYGENFLEDQFEVLNEPWATAKVEYDCVFQGQSMNNISATFDDSGNITSISLSPYKTNVYTPSPLMPISGTYHDKRVDLSGNEVEVVPDEMP